MSQEVNFGVRLQTNFNVRSKPKNDLRPGNRIGSKDFGDADMSQNTATICDPRTAKFHDLFLELGRVELLLERNVQNKSVDKELMLRSRRTKLVRALDRLAA